MYEVELHWKDGLPQTVRFPIVEETPIELRLIRDEQHWTVIPKANLLYYEITITN